MRERERERAWMCSFWFLIKFKGFDWMQAQGPESCIGVKLKPHLKRCSERNQAISFVILRCTGFGMISFSFILSFAIQTIILKPAVFIIGCDWDFSYYWKRFLPTAIHFVPYSCFTTEIWLHLPRQQCSTQDKWENKQRVSVNTRAVMYDLIQ